MDLISSWCAEAELAATPTAGQWVQLLPAGRFQGRDGRSFVLDNPQAVLAETAKRGDLPIDYEHQMDDPAARPATSEVRAAGWIKQLEACDDGIWGLVEWTEKARNMIEAREYRYLSPVLHHYPDGRVVRVIGAGLVHRPNLVLKALSSEQPGAALSQVATALGLPAEADAAAIPQDPRSGALCAGRGGGRTAEGSPPAGCADERTRGGGQGRYGTEWRLHHTGHGALGHGALPPGPQGIRQLPGIQRARLGASVPAGAKPATTPDRLARTGRRRSRDRGATGPAARRAGLTFAYRGAWLGVAAIQPEAVGRDRLGRFRERDWL